MARRTTGTFFRMRPVLSGMVAFCVGFGSPSCGSWSGNPPSAKVQSGTTTAPVEKQGTVEIVLQGSGTTLRLLEKSLAVTDKNGKPAGQIQLNSVQLVLSDITVRRDRSDVTARPKLAGPFVLDLLANSISPQPDKLTLPEGDYKEINLKLYQKAGGSVQLTGTYTSPFQKSYALKVTLDAEDQISLLNEARMIQVSSTANQQIAITFKMDQWFNFSGKDADLSNASGQDITIDASSTGDNRKLRDAFLTNVKAAADFDKYTGPVTTAPDDNTTKDGGTHNKPGGFGGGKGGR